MMNLASQHRRRLFYLLAILCLAGLMAGRHFMCDGSVYASVTDNLIASVLGSVVLVSVALYLWPPSEGTHELRPGEIRRALLDGVTSTSRRYLFRGRTGRFLAATVLPTLVKRSAESLRSLELRVQVLDPADARACGIYADYRRRIGADNDTVRDTQLKVLSQLVALHVARSTGLVRIDIYISGTFSLLRADIGDAYAVITRETKNEPGIKVAAGSPFYDLIVEDFNLTERLARRLPDTELIPRDALSVPTLRKLLQSWQLTIDLSDDEAVQVVELAKNPRDPYA